VTYVHLVTILVRDMPRTKEFYTELLGFEVVAPFTAPDGSFVWLKSERQGASIALQEAEKRYTKPVQADIPEQNGGLMLGFMVEDAEVAYKEFNAKGISLRTEVTDMGKGRTFGARDPEGNYIQIFDVYPQFREIQKQMGME
jgi:catechol 2,3-dioxygenase-like lactoylglutathione lyase family enzyme